MHAFHNRSEVFFPAPAVTEFKARPGDTLEVVKVGTSTDAIETASSLIHVVVELNEHRDWSGVTDEEADALIAKTKEAAKALRELEALERQTWALAEARYAAEEAA